MHAPPVPTDVQGGGLDERAGAEGPVLAVPGDLEREHAARRRGAPGRYPRRRRRRPDIAHG